MGKILPDVIANILGHYGAVVEKRGDGSLDVLSPPEVSRTINIPEYTRLVFSYDTEGHGIYASYDSDIFTSIKDLFTGGKFSVVTFEGPLPNQEKLSRVLPERIVLNNATYRLGGTEVRDISYLLLYFKYEAISDERCEGIQPLLINELNLSTMSFKGGVTDFGEAEEEKDTIQRHNIMDVFRAAHRAATGMVRKGLNEHIKGLERRLNRDIKRVYEYYGALREEAIRAIEEKVGSSREVIESEIKRASRIKTSSIMKGVIKQVEKMVEDYRNERERLEQIIKEKRWDGEKDEDIERMLAKVGAIEVEEGWKVQDLISKYSLNIHIRPITAIRIETMAPVFWIDIKRRLSSRRFPVTYNPVIRHFEPLPCESCYNPKAAYLICDDSLHILCPRCFEVCSHCGRQFCRACHRTCPRCKERPS